MTRKYHKYEETHREVDGRKEKYCTTCYTWKDQREFNIDRSGKDGLDMRCRDCARLHAQELYRKATRKKKVTVYIRFKDRHRTVNRVKQKLCTKCGEWKELNEYYKNSAQRDGLMGKCKKCTYNLTVKKK